MMKKIGIVFAMFALSLVIIPATSKANTVQPYGSGDWDYQGSDVFTHQSRNFKSGGGDFKVCLNKSSKEGNYRLMEEDPFNPDDWVVYDDNPYNYTGDVSFPEDFDSHGCVIYRNIGKYVDGSDHQAEFYLKKWSGGNSTVRAYD
ncbi:hypothetical protein [Scopulibacillus cellulosilyticus]|uniref:Peptidase inhibitor family I36 n=1 Tax=Scopulibacillus cellulosilyticus TaxID=2665665 RepID=A0ABW2Q7D2_9BACL